MAADVRTYKRTQWDNPVGLLFGILQTGAGQPAANPLAFQGWWDTSMGEEEITTIQMVFEHCQVLTQPDFEAFSLCVVMNFE